MSRDWLNRALAGLKGLSSAVTWPRLVTAGVFALAALTIYSEWRPPFAPFTTLGKIYVDSPEVYTRERLVNDRYDQDHWLREQLARLDQEQDFIASVYERTVTGAAGGPPQAGDGAGADGRTNGSATTPKLGFEDRFNILSGARDRIRQLILENMLDDRHDLSRNTLYGFKFDTTVVPGANTHSRAYVRVTARMQPFNALEKELEPRPRGAGGAGGVVPADPDALPGYFTAYFRRDPERREDEIVGSIERHNQLWLDSIEGRLNNYVISLRGNDGERCAPGAEAAGRDARQLSRDALEAILSMSSVESFRATQVRDGGSGAVQDATRLELPLPWKGFMSIQRKIVMTDCGEIPRFEVISPIQTYFIVPAKGGDFPDEDWAGPFYPISPRIDGSFIAIPYQGAEIISMEEYERILPAYDFTGGMLTALKEAEIPGALSEFCGDYLAELQNGECPAEAKIQVVNIPIGLFNMVEALKREDAFTYALFPKSNAEGRLTRERRDFGMAGAGEIRVERGESRADARSLVVGFADGNSASTLANAFGWVVSPPPGDPNGIQVTQMALLSIPAWASGIEFTIETGWLTDGSEERDPDQSYSLQVPLPPDFEAVDSVIWGEAREQSRGPTIRDNFIQPVNQPLVLGACESAEILIPGSRLWRSTEVTLGSQRARRISVLPNMDGIIAEFGPLTVPPPQSAAERALYRRIPRKLQVWTSEGVATSEKTIIVVAPPGDDYTCGG